MKPISQGQINYMPSISAAYQLKCRSWFFTSMAMSEFAADVLITGRSVSASFQIGQAEPQRCGVGAPGTSIRAICGKKGSHE